MGLFGAIGSVLGDAGSFLGDVATQGAISTSNAQEATNQQNINFQQATNAQQVALANTTYQRSVGDLEAAGLNPMLAYSGNTDPTPSITSPQAVPVSSQGAAAAGLASSAGSAAGMAIADRNATTQQDVGHSTIQVNEAKAEQATANAEESRVNTNLAKEKISTQRAQTQSVWQDYASKGEDVKSKQMGNEIQKARQGIDTKLAPADAIGERVKQASGIISNAMGGSGGAYSDRMQRAYERGTRAGSVTSGY